MEVLGAGLVLIKRRKVFFLQNEEKLGTDRPMQIKRYLDVLENIVW
jgi:hypothetical protein